MAYAWSQIKGTDKDGKAITVNPGDSVDAAKLNMSDEEFQVLMDEGVVRDNKYPENLPSDQSPTEYYKEQLAQMTDVPDKEVQEAVQAGVAGTDVANQLAAAEAAKEDAGNPS